MAKPRLFVGTRFGCNLAEAGVGFADLDQPYFLSAKTDRVALAGPAGEVLFSALYITIVHHYNATIHVTPIIDDVPQETKEITVAGTAPFGGPYTDENRAVDVVEIDL